MISIIIHVAKRFVIKFIKFIYINFKSRLNMTANLACYCWPRLAAAAGRSRNLVGSQFPKATPDSSAKPKKLVSRAPGPAFTSGSCAYIALYLSPALQVRVVWYNPNVGLEDPDVECEKDVASDSIFCSCLHIAPY